MKYIIVHCNISTDLHTYIPTYNMYHVSYFPRKLIDSDVAIYNIPRDKIMILLKWKILTMPFNHKKVPGPNLI